MEFRHTSVLLEESIEGLNIRPDGFYVDGTLGGAGHSYEIAKRLSAKGKLIGIDQDDAAIAASRERLRDYEDRTVLVRSNYENIRTILSDLGIDGVDGIILDLGVSSYQIDNAQRGFSYMQDAPLDMRMDTRQILTAETVVNEYSKEELTGIISRYGEERFAANIAKHIVSERNKGRIKTTAQLSDIVRQSVPMKFQQNGHPAKKTFQAIRIEVNGELKVLENSIDEMINSLNPTGRLCVITFHSLEDRIVKNKFRENENPCTCPPDFPVCVCGKKSKGTVITKKPVLPDEYEMDKNPRSKSAKLRIFERK